MRFRLNKGFTLIELLITVVLFSLVMTSLMVGLHTGVNSWKRVRAHQEFMAHTERAFEVIGMDLRHMVRIHEDNPPLTESELPSGAASLEFTALVPNIYHAQGRRAVWADVNYSLVEDEEVLHENSFNLKRSWSPQVANSALDGGLIEETLLTQLSSIEFDYLGDEGLVPEWEDPEQLPRAVLVSIQFQSGKTMERMISLPLGIRP